MSNDAGLFSFLRRVLSCFRSTRLSNSPSRQVARCFYATIVGRSRSRIWPNSHNSLTLTPFGLSGVGASRPVVLGRVAFGKRFAQNLPWLGIASIVLLTGFGIVYGQVIQLAIKRERAFDALHQFEETDQYVGESDQDVKQPDGYMEQLAVAKNLNANFEIRYLLMWLIFYACLFRTAVSSICSFVALRKSA